MAFPRAAAAIRTGCVLLPVCSAFGSAFCSLLLGCGANALEWERAMRENERLRVLTEIHDAPPGTKMEGVTVRQPSIDPCPTDEAPEAVVPFGQPARTTEYRISVATVKECAGDDIERAKPGEILLGVELLVEAIGPQSVSVGSGRNQIVDGDGHSYTDILNWSAPCGPALRMGSVQPGSRARGWIAFSLPKQAKDLVLHYSLPFSFGKTNKLIRFGLGR